MTETKTRRAALLALALLLAAQLAVLLYYGAMKQNFYVDGYFSFNLGNSRSPLVEGGSFQWGTTTPEAYAHDYLAVTPGNALNLRQVWHDQAVDVHPPLYYLVIHLLSAVFLRGWRFGPALRLGLAVNFAFALGSTALAYDCLRRITGSRAAALAGAALAALSPSVIDMATLVRMYVMAGFFVLLAVRWHLAHWQKPLTRRGLAGLLAVAAAGILTHYYVLLFLFFMGLWFGVRLLAQRRRRDAAAYAGTLAGSVALSLAVFPGMYGHLFSSYRGTEAAANLTDASLAGRLFGQDGMAALLDRFLLGGRGALLAAGLAVLWCAALAAFFIRKTGTKKAGAGEAAKASAPRGGTAAQPAVCPGGAVMLAFTCLCNFVLISKIAAFVTLRYQYFLCLPALIALAAAVYFGARALPGPGRRKAGLALGTAGILALTAATALSVRPEAYEYLNLDAGPRKAQIAASGVTQMVFVGDAGWHTLDFFEEVEGMQTLRYLRPDEVESLRDAGLAGQRFYLYAATQAAVEPDALVALVQAVYPQDSITYQFESTFAKVYLVEPAAA